MERKSECQGCGAEMEYNPIDPTPVEDELSDFISKQEHWGDHPAPTVCWGMLRSVLKVIHYLAPSDKEFMQLVMDVVSEFKEVEKC